MIERLKGLKTKVVAVILAMSAASLEIGKAAGVDAGAVAAFFVEASAYVEEYANWAIGVIAATFYGLRNATDTAPKKLKEIFVGGETE